MSTLTFPIADLVNRLKSLDSVRLVELVGPLEVAIQQPPRAMPALGITSSSIGKGILYSGSPVQQDRETALHCLLWVNNARGAADAAAELDRITGEIDARLAGWIPDDPFGAVRFVGHRDELAEGSTYARQLSFSCRWTFSAQVQP